LTEAIGQSQDKSLVDYVLQQTFPLPRSMATFTERGQDLAKDLRDGENPSTILYFSQAILQLRNDPGLLAEIRDLLKDTMCPIVLEKQCVQQQNEALSVFFVAGGHKILDNIEQRLGFRRLLKVYPSDFWLDFSKMPFEDARH
jgi:hypothetical protein